MKHLINVLLGIIILVTFPLWIIGLFAIVLPHDFGDALLAEWRGTEPKPLFFN